MNTFIAFVLIAHSAASPGPTTVWPGREWETASPESQGLSSAGLREAAAYSEKHGGGSGCIVRHGYLVGEWGSPAALADIKSATKGSVGTTVLGLAVDAGLVKLEDRALQHYPALGSEKPENVASGWLGEITVHQLATMSAGFDDGRPPRLVRRPGSGGEYSNDTSNALAELLTLRFREDLSAVLKRKVMDPLGVPAGEWAWRSNVYRPKTIGGLASREFASGITITHRALARIGYLYLRQGEWDGKRILSKEFVILATRPTDLAAPFSYYALYWGSNAKGTYPEIPRDAYWALGLGDSFVAVCPSLDLVAVRLGLGSTKSQLPGGEDWGLRVAGFLRLVTASVKDSGDARPAARAGAELPPPSPVIRGIRWAPKETIVRKAEGSDNWPLTWGDDDALYGAYGDGRGFEPYVPEKLSLGLARVSGLPPDIAGLNVRAPTLEQMGDGRGGKKASGLLMVERVLYLWARNAGNAQLAWSPDRGATWSWCDWKLAPGFGCPAFLNFGKNYSGARDEFVYVYSHDSESAYQPADRTVLARAHRAPWRSSASYAAGLGRYLLVQPVPGAASRGRDGEVDVRFAGGLAIFDAPEPWGPWTTAYFTESWDVGPGDTASFPTRWMSPDGRTLHLVFSGNDAFSVRQATLIQS